MIQSAAFKHSEIFPLPQMTSEGDGEALILGHSLGDDPEILCSFCDQGKASWRQEEFSGNRCCTHAVFAVFCGLPWLPSQTG